MAKGARAGHGRPARPPQARSQNLAAGCLSYRTSHWRDLMSSTESANAKVVREFTRIFKNEHNVDGVDHLFDPGFQHHFRVPVPAGLDGFKAIGRTLNGAFPD